MTIEKVKEGFTKLMGWTGPQLLVVDFVLSAYLTTYLPGDVARAWGVLVGGPGIGKSETLKTLIHQTSIHKSDFTENAFVSGYLDKDNPDRDPSLLADLQVAAQPVGLLKVLVIHELTNITSYRADRVNTLFGRMRSAFEGDFNPHSGTKGGSKYSSPFGLLMASTESFDDYLRSSQVVGERSLIFRLAPELAEYGARRKLALVVADSDADRAGREAIRKQLHQDVKILLEDMIPKVSKAVPVKQDPALVERVALATNVTTSARTMCRASGGFVSVSEPATRFQKQIRGLLDTHAMLEGRAEWAASDYELALKIARDTVLPENSRLLAALWNGGKPISLTWSDACVAARVLPEIAKKQLTQWAVIGFCEQVDRATFALTPASIQDIVSTGYIKEKP